MLVKHQKGITMKKEVKRTTVTLETDLRDYVQERAARSRRKFSKEINAILEEAMAREDGPPPRRPNPGEGE